MLSFLLSLAFSPPDPFGLCPGTQFICGGACCPVGFECCGDEMAGNCFLPGGGARCCGYGRRDSNRLSPPRYAFPLGY